MKLDGDKFLADLKNEADALQKAGSDQHKEVVKALMAIQLAIYRGNYTIKDDE
jgi:hypothetical protein